MNLIVQRMLLGVLAGLITAGAAAAAITRTLTQMVCGSVDMSASFITGLVVVFAGDTRTVHPPAGCEVPVTGIRLTATGVALIVATVIAVIVVLWWRWRQSDQYFIWEMRGRAGFAKRWELRKHSSAKAMLGRAKTIRPTLTNPNVEDVAWRIGRSNGQDVHVSAEDSIVLEGPPRQGKGFRVLIAAIIDWSGPLITTSTRSDNLTTTMRARQSKGTVSVFDPQGLSGISGALKVDPTDGCQDPLVAVQRAEAIVGGTALGQSSTNREWASAAAGIMSRLLHAASVSGGGVDKLYTWGTSPQHALEAADILDSDGTPGWADELRSVIEDDPKLRSSMWMGVKESVKPLAIPTIRDSMKPGRSNRFDADTFLSGQNTLYLIGTGSGAGAVGGFLGAVLDDIVERARTRAMVSTGGRLEMPLGLVLDEIVNMFSWRALPTLMADGGGIGIARSWSCRPCRRRRPRGRTRRRTPSGQPRPRRSSSAAPPTSPTFATSSRCSAPGK